MGLDLNILPQFNQKSDFSLDVIKIHRDYELFDIIKKLEKTNGRNVSNNGISSYLGTSEESEENCYGDTTKTPYGDIIKGVQAGKMKEVLSDFKTDSWKNKAFIAFLNELPDDLEIWLYWC